MSERAAELSSLMYNRTVRHVLAINTEYMATVLSQVQAYLDGMEALARIGVLLEPLVAIQGSTTKKGRRWRLVLKADKRMPLCRWQEGEPPMSPEIAIGKLKLEEKHIP